MDYLIYASPLARAGAADASAEELASWIFLGAVRSLPTGIVMAQNLTRRSDAKIVRVYKANWNGISDLLATVTSDEIRMGL